jgi:hypothetical protein
MIEAMACGTPVLAFRRGSVPEVISGGVSGFIVGTVEEAVAAVPRLATLDRAGVRSEFERRFTADRMARDYVRLYQQLRATQSASLPRISMGPAAASDDRGPRREIVIEREERRGSAGRLAAGADAKPGRHKQRPVLPRNSDDSIPTG